MGRSNGGLTALDLSLADCVEAGEVFSLGRFIEQHPDEARDALANGEFSIHSDIIRRLLEGRPLPGESQPRVLTDAGVRILGRGSNQQDEQNSDDAEKRRRRFQDFVDKVRDKTEKDEGLFDEVLDLSGITTDHPIELISCHLNGGLKLENSKIRSFKLSNSTTAFISAWDMEASGSFEAHDLGCRGDVILTNSRIAGDLNFHSLQHLLDKTETAEVKRAMREHHPPEIRSRNLVLLTAQIGGDLHLSNVKLFGNVWITGTKIGGSAFFAGAIIKNRGGAALTLANASIGNNLELSDTIVEVLPLETAVDGTGLVVEGSILITSGPTSNVRFTGKVEFLNAKVRRNFQISSRNRDGPYNVFHGTLSLVGAKIGAHLILKNLVCTHGLVASGLQATLNIDLREGFRVYGDTNLENSVAGQDLLLPLTDCRRERRRSTRNFLQSVWWCRRLALSTVLKGASNTALRRYNEVREGVAPRKLNINLTGAEAKTFKVNTKLGLLSLNLDLGGFRYDAIRFAHRKWWVNSYLPKIAEVPYHNVSSTGVIWFVMAVLRFFLRPVIRFILSPLTRLTKRLWNLQPIARARATLAKTSFAKWTKGVVRWGKWVFDIRFRPRIEYEQPDITEAKALIQRLPRGISKFSRQPYDQLIVCLKKGGHEASPRKIEYMKQERLRQELGAGFPFSPSANPARWLFLTVMNFTSGHGLKVTKTFYLAFVCLFVSWWTFAATDKIGMMKPLDGATMARMGDTKARTQKPACGTMAEKTDCIKEEGKGGIADQYPDFVPIAYAVDIFIPLINLYQEHYWFPSPSEIEKPLRCKELHEDLARADVTVCSKAKEIWIYRLMEALVSETENADLSAAVQNAYLLTVETIVGRYVMAVRYLLPIAGWLLTSILIAVGAARFQDVVRLVKD